MGKCCYKITINKKCAKCQIEKEYKFSRIDFCVGIDKDCAFIKYSLNEHKAGISFATNYIKDAIRRILLMHILQYGKSLEIKTITVTIAGETKHIEKTELPVINSILPKQVSLNEKWQDEKFQNEVFQRKKSEFLQDQRISALSNFLASSNKQYEPDRLVTLWSAMNACYSYIFGNEGKEWKKIKKFSEGMNCRIETESYISNDEHKMLAKLALSFASLIYPDTVEYENGEILVRDEGVSEKVQNTARYFGIDEFGVLLLRVPYERRCKYVHGEKPQILFCICNDAEISILHVINECLWAFLKDFIPGLFNTDLLQERRFANIKQKISEVNGSTTINA